MCKRSIRNITSWNTESEYQKNKIKNLLKDVRKFLNFVEKKFNFDVDYPFNKIYIWLENKTCEECIEYIVSIMMEPFNYITKPLINEMSSEEEKYFNIPAHRSVKELKSIIKKRYPNIIKINFQKKKIIKNFGLFQKIKKSLDWQKII